MAVEKRRLSVGEIIAIATFTVTLLGTIGGVIYSFAQQATRIDDLERRVTVLEQKPSTTPARQPSKIADACMDLLDQQENAKDDKAAERVAIEIEKFHCSRVMRDTAAMTTKAHKKPSP